MRTLEADFAIVGSGVAGLRAALALERAGRDVLLVSKDPPSRSATGTAQGGVAAAMGDDDEIALHYRDTLKAGDGLCRPSAVRVLVGEGPAAIDQLLAWGTRFDREGGRLAFGREAAHSVRRILHAHDSTGREILRALVERLSGSTKVRRISNLFTLDLLPSAGRVRGVLCLDEKHQELVRIHCRSVLLATGGLGCVYRDTTNPSQATGDGVAMAWRAGAVVSNLEFVQFHPTALFVDNHPRHLLTEALRGEGAVLRDTRGERFLAGKLAEAELAPRDRLSRAIEDALRRSGEACVFLDLTSLAPGHLERRFPGVALTCRAAGIDPLTQPVPVRPAAHYAMGGVRTDLHGRSSLPGLYAAGEVACTGVHGANRLASNSLLEGLVFGARAGEAMLRDAAAPGAAVPAEAGAVTAFSRERALRVAREVGDLMWADAGIVREGRGLGRALGRLRELESESKAVEVSRDGAEAFNLVSVAQMIVRLALWRRESRGAHWREDFPAKNRRFRGHSCLKLGMEPRLESGRWRAGPRRRPVGPQRAAC